MSLDLGALQEESSRLKDTATGGGSDWMENFVKFPEGNGVTVVRLLGPAASGMFGRNKSPFYQVSRIHRVNGKSLHCPKNLDGKRWVGDCPICQYYNYLWQESEKKGAEEAAKMQAQARAIKPIDRYYYNCIVRRETLENGEVRENVGPKILSVGKTLHQMILRGILGDENLDEKGYGDVTDVKAGRDFKIIKTMRQSGKESYPNYDTSKFMDPSPLGTPDQVATWLQAVHDLASLRTLKDMDELKLELKKHLGLAPVDDTGSGFDPREYQVSVTADEPTVRVNKVSEPPKSEVEKAAAGTSEGSESVVDEEFFNTLRNLG